MQMKTSLVMTTYNGVKYLKDQLDSIKNQSLQPDEVIIVDDCSTDDTVKFLKDYIYKYSLDCWKIYINSSNQGWKKNFKIGIDKATNPLIFLADQDDIWHLNKIEKMTMTMNEDSDILLLCSNYHIFVEGKDKSPKTYFQKMNNDGKVEKISINPKWAYISRPGCTYCFRRSFYESIKNQWDTNYAHDAILWRWACIYDGLFILNEPLIEFRRHGDNSTSNVKKSKLSRLNDIRCYEHYYEIAINNVKNEKDRNILLKGVKFLKLREQLLENGRFSDWLVLLLFYRKYYYTLKGCFADLLFSKKYE